MKIELLHAYQGRLTGETLLEAGLQEVEDVLGEYLIANGHAIQAERIIIPEGLELPVIPDYPVFANGENELPLNPSPLPPSSKRKR